MKSRLLGSFFLVCLCSSSVSEQMSWDYKRYDSGYKWEDAEKKCIDEEQGNLVTRYENVSHWYWHRYRAWIGLRKDGEDLVWSDGGSYNFSAWLKNASFDGSCASVFYPNVKVYFTGCERHFFFFCQTTIGSSRTYTFIPEPMKWSEAKEHCKDHYESLASFSNLDLYPAVTQQEFHVWIGLHKEGGAWKWSTITSDESKLNLLDLQQGGDCASISSRKRELATHDCNDRFPFICQTASDNIILVTEQKTWEEALEHCRALTSPSNSRRRFDLLSVQPGDDPEYLMNKVQGANTEEVWTGLHFLAGEWLWVDGAVVQHADLPLCPIQWHHCGALPKKYNRNLKARNCMEKKNFLCYSITES